MTITCDVPGCWQRRHKFSRYCRPHMKKDEDTGHPLGWTVRKAWLRPWQGEAARFIRDHLHHPDLERPLAHLEAILAQAKRPTVPRTDADKLHLWLSNLREAGVSAQDVLACVVGMYWLQERLPERFKGDRHFRHQLAVRVLRLAPAPNHKAWDKGREYRLYQRIGVKVRELLASVLIRTTGAAPLRIIRAIEQGHQENLLDHLITNVCRPDILQEVEDGD
ncbi:MAG: hypothetical protein AB1916_05615 [Thermodesulfobacteriota bacterium]